MEAAWVAKLEAAVEAVEELLVPADTGEEVSDWGDEDSLAVALEVVEAAYEAADQALEERVIAWLAEDPEHWPIFRLVVLDPWQERPGGWRAEAPSWVRSLGTDAVMAHFQQDLYGRRRTLDIGDFGR